jgi:undecaprenyl diphosphate synthase
MAYDGREELAEAAATGADSVAALGQALWTADLPPVDLVLRTAGEPHLSAGFLLWHIAEAQLAFVDPPWPAFSPDDLTAVIARYSATERRFGR